MPELPEVQTVVNELNQKLKNKTVKSVEVLLGKMIGVGPATLSPKRKAESSKVQKFIKLLRGQKIKSVGRRAKLLVFDFYGPYAMLVHLKMTGQFIYFKKTELGRKVRIINNANAPLHAMPCPYTRVIFTLTDGSRLFYNDVRQFGYLKLIHDNEVGKVAELQEFGPEPLSRDFTWLSFLTAVKKNSRIKIKQLLTDQRIIAGIGNIYSDEILFRAKIRPTRTAGSLSKYELKYIFKYIPIVLRQAVAAHGSSVGDFIRTDGSFGSMGKRHFVYNRGGEACKVCGATIKTAKIGGRTGSFCPKCQR